MAVNPYDIPDDDPEYQQLLKRYGVATAPNPQQNTGFGGDTLTSLKRGVEQIPGMVTGLADIGAAPFSAATGVNRPFSRLADAAGELTGFQPGKWAKEAEAEYSPQYQESKRAFDEAQGFTDSLGAIARNPRYALGTVAESLPSMVAGAGAGGLAVRGALGAERLAALRAGAAAGDAAAAGQLARYGAGAAGLGEGAVTAGQQMDQLDYNIDPLRAAGTSLAAGALTGAIGYGAGRLANKLGITDIDTALATGSMSGNPVKGLGQRLGRGAIGAFQEGVLEEMPQSMQEQIWQNVAEGKPWDEGIGKAAAMGAVSGGLMGGGINVMAGRTPEQPKEPDAETKQATNLLGFNPEIGTSWNNTYNYNPIIAEGSTAQVPLNMLDAHHMAEQRTEAAEMMNADLAARRQGELYEIGDFNLNDQTLPMPQDPGDAVAALQIISAAQAQGQAVVEGSRAYEVVKEAQRILESIGASGLANRFTLGTRAPDRIVSEAAPNKPFTGKPEDTGVARGTELFNYVTDPVTGEVTKTPIEGVKNGKPVSQVAQRSNQGSSGNGRGSSGNLGNKSGVGRGGNPVAGTPVGSGSTNQPVGTGTGGVGAVVQPRGAKAKEFETKLNAAIAKGEIPADDPLVTDWHATKKLAGDAKNFEMALADRQAGPTTPSQAPAELSDEQKVAAGWVKRITYGKDADGKQVENVEWVQPKATEKKASEAVDINKTASVPVADEKTFVERLMKSIPERSRRILELYHFDKQPLEDIGETLANEEGRAEPYTRARISQLRTEAVNQIKAEAAKLGVPPERIDAYFGSERNRLAGGADVKTYSGAEVAQSGATMHTPGEVNRQANETEGELENPIGDESVVIDEDSGETVTAEGTSGFTDENGQFDVEPSERTAEQTEEGVEDIYDEYAGWSLEATPDGEPITAADITAAMSEWDEVDVRPLNDILKAAWVNLYLLRERGIINARVFGEHYAKISVDNQLLAESPGASGQNDVNATSQGNEANAGVPEAGSEGSQEGARQPEVKVRKRRTIERPEGEVKRSILGETPPAKLSSRILQWAQQVLIRRAKDPVVALVTSPNAILRKIGIYRPVTLDIEHANHIMQTHPEITPEDLAALPDLLLRPRAAFAHGTGFNFIVDARDSNGRPLLVALNNTTLKGGGTALKVTGVSTLFGQDDSAATLVRNLQAGNVKFMAQKEVARLQDLLSLGETPRNTGTAGATNQDQDLRHEGLIPSLTGDASGYAPLQAELEVSVPTETGEVKISVPSGAVNRLKGVQFSNSESAGVTNPTTVAGINKLLKGLFFSGKRFSDKVVVVQSVVGLDPALRSKHDEKTQAFVKGDKVYMIADNIEAGKELAVFLHEVGAHLGMQKLLGPENYAKLVEQVKVWAEEHDGKEGDLARKALRRVLNAEENLGEEYGQQDFDDELLAYFVEESVLSGVNPTAIKGLSGTLQQWFAGFMNAVRAALRKFGIDRTETLTAQDVVDLAYGAAALEVQDEVTDTEATTSEPSGVAKYSTTGKVLPDFAEELFYPQSAEDRRNNYANRLKNPIHLKDGSRLSGFTDPSKQTTFHGYDKNGERFTLRVDQLNVDDIAWSKDSNRTADKLRKALSGGEKVRRSVIASPQMRQVNTQVKTVLQQYGEFFGDKFQSIENALMFGHNLAKKAAALIPGAKEYFDSVQKRQTERVKQEQEIARIANAHYSLDTDTQKAVNRIIDKSTSEEKWAFVPTWFKDTKIVADPALEAEFRKLPKEAQQIVKDVFKYGSEQQQRFDESVNKNLPPEEQVKRNQMYGKPYAPLKRFGDHVVVGKSAEFAKLQAAHKEGTATSKELEAMMADPDHYHVEFVDGDLEAIKRRDQLAKSNPQLQWEKKPMQVEDRLLNAMSFTTLKRLEKQIAASDGNPKTKAALEALANQMYVAQLNHMHANKSQQSRKGVKGYDADMMRAFVSQGRAEAALIASLMTHAESEKALQAIKTAAREGGNQDRKTRIANEVMRRHLALLNYQDTPVQNLFMAMNSLFMLLTSPAYYLTNGSQPFVASLPYMASRFGGSQSWTTLRGAYKDALELVKVKKLFRPQDLSVEHLKQFNQVGREADALKQLMDENLVDIGMEMELGDIAAAGGNAISKNLSKAMMTLRTGVANVEVLNRLSSATAGYRLAYAEAISKGKDAETAHTEATDYARKVILDTHGNYAGYNAPSVMMQGAYGSVPLKLMTQFKKFAFIQAGLLIGSIKTAVQSQPSEERAAARALLKWMAGTQFLLAGAMGGTTGIPAAILGSLAAAMGGDDGEDKEAYLRRILGGGALAQLILHGAPAAMGVDISKRVGMGASLDPLRLTDPSTDAKDAALALAGPSVGLASRFATGLDYMYNKGQYWKGMEMMIPNGIATNLSKIARYESQGLTNSRGDVVMKPEEIGLMTDLMQGLGLETTQLSDRRWKSQVIYDRKQHFEDKAAEIKRDYIEDRKAGGNGAEARQEWMKLQAERVKQGFQRQKMSDLIGAPRAQAKRERDVVNGLQYEKTNRKFVQSVNDL